MMEQRIDYLCFLSLLLFLHVGSKLPSLCEGRSSKLLKQVMRGQEPKDVNHIDSFSPSPFDIAMSPSSSPQDFPPYCIYPPPLPPYVPLSPPPPSTIIPNPSPPETGPGSPFITPSPPAFEPSPPGFEPNPPIIMPSPPGFVPSPPEYFPGPPEFIPGPPLFLPPVIYPPPTVPPSPHAMTTPVLWCVAKPTVPDPIIQEAMNYACGSGADCDSIQPNGSCYQPDTLIAHASFAFNSYWQRTKVAGGTCDFGGTAMLITRDPSYDGCRFIIY